MIVCNLSTPANYFHALRRQVLSLMKKPLILMTPKSLLRHPEAISNPAELTGGGFKPVIGAEKDPLRVRRVVVCSGKVYYDLVAGLHQQRSELQDLVAIVRLEQYYPLPRTALQEELSRYSADCEFCWAQEEPANMGAWTYIRPELSSALRSIHPNRDFRIQYAGRLPSASPATGSAKVHQLEQMEVVESALTVVRV